MSKKSDKRKLLVELKKKMKNDKSLPLLPNATNLVFGEGSAESAIMFIGEGPGFWEDKKGRPFVGRAGKLLDLALQKIGMKRKDVFITNVVHHRPPQNRDPKEEEITAYAKYLDKMIKIIKPQIICTLGRFSMAKFLPGVYISKVHGKVKKVTFQGKKYVILPLYHPAAALRNGKIKEAFLKDFEKLKKFTN